MSKSAVLPSHKLTGPVAPLVPARLDELNDEELGALLIWEADDPASEERWSRIDAAILGIVPKPAPAT